MQIGFHSSFTATVIVFERDGCYHSLVDLYYIILSYFIYSDNDLDRVKRGDDI